MKTLFISAGPIEWGSSRMRVFWPAELLDADVILFDRLQSIKMEYLEPYDAVIFQKQGAPELQEHLQNSGTKVFWDVCDPMWWFSPQASRLICARTDGVVASSPALAEDFNRWLGRPYATVIADRLKLEHFSRYRRHTDAQPIRMIWYGVAANRVSLAGAWANLSRLKANGIDVELTIFDDRPDVRWEYGNEVPVYHITWSLAQEVEVLSSHDIALLPPYPGPWGDVKSNNKVLTASACGLPVTEGHNYGDLLELVREPALRQAQSEAARRDVQELWSVERSAAQWREVLEGSDT